MRTTNIFYESEVAETERLVRPIFADKKRIYDLLGIPEGTLHQLARDLIVACHKLGEAKQAKTVYLFDDCEKWVKAQGAPDWVRTKLSDAERFDI